MTVEARSVNWSTSSTRKKHRTTFACNGQQLTAVTSDVPNHSLSFSHNWQIDTEFKAKIAAGQRKLMFGRTQVRTETFPWNSMTFHYGCASNPNRVTDQQLYTDSDLSGGTLPHSFLTMVTGPLDAQAANKARLNLHEGRVNLAQAFAERKQIANMFSSTVRRLCAAFRSVKRGNPKEALATLGQPFTNPRRYGKGAAQDFLAMQFGWKPLMSDLYNVFQALGPADGRLLLQGVGRHGDMINSKSFAPSGTPSLRRDVVRYRETSATVKTTLDFAISDFVALAAAQTDLVNPLAVVWELVPFSFIGDWILPIGDYLESLTATQGLNYLGGVTSRIIGRTSVVSGRVFHTASTGTDGWGRTTSSELRRERIVHTTVPGPSLSVKNPFSTLHVAEVVALLAVFNL